MTEDFPDNIATDQMVEKMRDERFEKILEGLNIEQLVSEMAKIIAADPIEAKAKLITMIGGAASGKSTLADQLITQLGTLDIAADSIGTDDYVVGDRAFRREHFEGKEPKAKYDFGLMNAKISEITHNQNPDHVVPVPTYDGHSGVAIAAGEENYTHTVGKVGVLIVEGDFDEVATPDLKIFVHVPDALRLENRVGRDQQTRNEADAEKIRENFYQRQQTQHIPYTVPAVETSDILVDAKFADGLWSYDVYSTINHAQNS